MEPFEPCSRARIFDGADVNVVVLPYRSTLPDAPELGSAGEQLAALIQVDALLSLLPYERVGATRMIEDRPGECTPEHVLDKTRVPGFTSPESRRGLVLVWGGIYREGDDYYLQTHVRFGRRGAEAPAEHLRIRLGERSLMGEVSAQDFTFPARHLSRADLASIAKEFASTFTLRSRPDKDAPGQPLQADLRSGPSGYWVTETAGEWMRIESDKGAKGWIRGGVSLGAQPLARRLPEVGFIEGLSGYLAYRMHPEKAAFAESAEAALRSYADETASSALPRVVSRELIGLLKLLRGGQRPESFVAAGERFAEAARILPSDAAAKNLHAITRAYLAFETKQTGEGPADIEDELWSAMSVEPNSEEVVRTMWSVYAVAQSDKYRSKLPAGKNIAKEELSRRQTSLEKVQIDGRKVAFSPALGPSDWPDAPPPPPG